MISIKPDREYMYEILDKIKKGKIRIPKFQRDFIWDYGQILDLWDSIIKGFPIGSLIFWTPEEERFKDIDDIEGVKVDIHSVSNSPIMYVLDGRQRLTVLLSSLFEGGRFVNQIYFNLEDKKPFRKISGKATLNEISLNEAYDSYSLVGYLERLKASQLSDAEKTRFAEVAKSINKVLQTYAIGYVTASGGNISDAVEIFSRLNSKGTGISEDFMIQALTYDKDSDFLFGEAISQIKESLQSYNFSDISRDLIFKCVYNYTEHLFIDGDIKEIIKLGERLPKIMTLVGDEIRKAVQFLYKECGTIDSRLLPYSYHLLILADFFRIVPNPTLAQRKELKKWFFYTVYSNYFTNTSFSRIRKDLEEFRKFAKGVISSPVKQYSPLKISPFPEKYSLKSVRICGFALISLLNCGANESEYSTLETFTIPINNLDNRKCANTIVCGSKTEAIELMHLFKDAQSTIFGDYEKYCLSLEMVQLYREGKHHEFLCMRQNALKDKESEFLCALGLNIV